MRMEYTVPECVVHQLKSRNVICALSGGYGSGVGKEGEAGGGIDSDDIIDGGSF